MNGILEAITPVTSETMRKAVGFRNVAVHNYDAINWEIVFAICQKSFTAGRLPPVPSESF